MGRFGGVLFVVGTWGQLQLKQSLLLAHDASWGRAHRNGNFGLWLFRWRIKLGKVRQGTVQLTHCHFLFFDFLFLAALFLV